MLVRHLARAAVATARFHITVFELFYRERDRGAANRQTTALAGEDSRNCCARVTGGDHFDERQRPLLQLRMICNKPRE